LAKLGQFLFSDLANSVEATRAQGCARLDLNIAKSASKTASVFSSSPSAMTA